MKQERNNSTKWWKLTTDEVIQKMQSCSSDGLSHTTAQQRLHEYGGNVLPEADQTSTINLFISQFSSVIVWVLLGALIISGFLGEWAEALVIGAIIVLNGIVGFVQEYQVEKSLDELKKLTQPTTRVLRNGHHETINIKEVVPGDIIMLEAGAHIPADGRIISADNLMIKESTLTGESLPTIKKVAPIDQESCALSEQANMAFMGTSVLDGTGVLVVTATGLATQLGTIAHHIQQTEVEETPLQKQLTKIGYQLIALCLSTVTLIFIMGIIRGTRIMTMLLSSLSLAVAAIPEGLPAVITITLSLGVWRLAKKKALVRRLSSVETLGATTIICSDKTGTLTENKMVVTDLWVNHEQVTLSGTGYIPIGTFRIEGNTIHPKEYPDLMLMLKISALCNSATLNGQSHRWTIQGDPTEGALLVAAQKAGWHLDELKTHNKLIKDYPFNGERKLMSSLREQSDGRTLYVKGAPEKVLAQATLIRLHGSELPLDEDHKKEILNQVSSFGQQALRVLAVGYKKITLDQNPKDITEDNLIFVGLLAMIDPPREEVTNAIDECKRAGIRPIMITGDHPDTAVAIAQKLTIVDEQKTKKIITGSELDTMDDYDLKQVINEIAIYARTTAEHKLRIVNAYKKRGEIVAVTGDGVNDAPAIKAAHIGVAMGITGTEVTKQAADMVITDDNFASIVDAVREGRGIYDNMVKFISYLISANLAELIIIFLGTLIALKSADGSRHIPLLPIHLLWLNLITDGLPAIALGADPTTAHVMSRKPRDSRKSIFSYELICELIIMALLMAGGALAACLYGLKIDSSHSHTMTLTSLVVLEFVRVHLIRSSYGLSFFSNKWLAWSLLGSLGIHFVVIYHPWLQPIFNTTPLTAHEWVAIWKIALVVWLIGTGVTKLIRYVHTKISLS